MCSVQLFGNYKHVLVYLKTILISKYEKESCGIIISSGLLTLLPIGSEYSKLFQFFRLGYKIKVENDDY